MLNVFPAAISTLAGAQPQYEEHPGWLTDTTGCTRWDDLPPNAQSYLARLSDVLDTRIDLVSVGPRREQTIRLHEPFDTE